MNLMRFFTISCLNLCFLDRFRRVIGQKWLILSVHFTFVGVGNQIGQHPVKHCGFLLMRYEYFGRNFTFCGSLFHENPCTVRLRTVDVERVVDKTFYQGDFGLFLLDEGVELFAVGINHLTGLRNQLAIG